MAAWAVIPHRFSVDPATRVMTRADCEALFKRIVAFTRGGGDTEVTARVTWTANLRWARNRPTSSGDTIAYTARITRLQLGKAVTADVDQLDDATLTKTVQQLEQQLATWPARLQNQAPKLLGPQTYLTPALWDAATFALTPLHISDAVRRSVDPVVDARLDAVGYAEVSAATWAIFNTQGLAAHAVATGGLYTETVRDREGTASGWAGKSHTAWGKVDPAALSAIALRKCQDSANPLRVEPGRYTTILEPKAVALLMWGILRQMDRKRAERGGTPFSLPGEQRSKIGAPLFDARLTITSDPMDPDCGFIPFDDTGTPYRNVTWVERGILKALPYNRAYAQATLGTDEALPNPQAYRISGGNTSVEEMIATTERGIYVTHFEYLYTADAQSMSTYSVTRDGVWLIERGKIVHPIKNMWMFNSLMVVFNSVLQIGPAVRTVGVFLQGWGGHTRDMPVEALNDGYMPLVAPTMKIRDFNFNRLSEAI